MANPWDRARNNPVQYMNWRYSVNNGDTLMSFAEWMRFQGLNEEEEDK